MDDQFKRASKEIKFTYNSSFWNDVSAKLDDDSLDEAFVAAAGTPIIMPDLNVAESIDDAFLDESFKTVDDDVTVDFKPEYWAQFQSNLESIQQDEAFVSASNAAIADYHPHYWSDADMALQNEGLHYEYNTAYWNEAKVLLDKSDRGYFFTRWSAVAGILLLISFATLFPTGGEGNRVGLSRVNSTNNSVVVNHTNFVIDNDTENLLVDNVGNNSNQDNSVDALNENSLLESINDVVVVDSRTIDLSDGNNLVSSDITQSADEAIELGNRDFIGLNSIRLNTSPKSDELIGDLRIKNVKNQSISPLQSSLAYINLTPNIHIEKLKLKPSHHVSLLASGGLGNKYGAQDLTPTWRSSGGIEYLYTPRKSLQRFEFGASFLINHVRQNNFGTERRVNVFQTSGDVDKFWFKLQLKDMLYAGTNFGMNYKFDNRNKIKFTLGVDYLVFAQSNMSYQNKAEQGITTVNNNWGVKDGLNTFDFKLGLGYEFQATSRLALQVNANFGVLDRTDNEFMRNKINDHEMSGSIGLKYTVFRK